MSIRQRPDNRLANQLGELGGLQTHSTQPVRTQREALEQLRLGAARSARDHHRKTACRVRRARFALLGARCARQELGSS